jgi:DNA topoisomerase-1
VTDYLQEHFRDIVDLGFTSSMEEKLDKVEDGTEQWKELLHDFYGEFSEEIQKAKTGTKGEKLKVPDEVTDEICEVCGARMVKKKGRFGSFLACPNFPNCTFTKPIVIVMPGKCPKCGGRILKRTSRNSNVYYSCEENKPICSYHVSAKPDTELCPKCGGKILAVTDDDGKPQWACENNLQRRCDFITWDVPTDELCPACGKTMFKRSGRGQAKSFCENENCVKFVPAEQRGYRRKTAGKSSEKSTGKSTGKTAGKSTGKTAGKTAGKSGKKTSGKAGK